MKHSHSKYFWLGLALTALGATFLTVEFAVFGADFLPPLGTPHTALFPLGEACLLIGALALLVFFLRSE